MITIYTCSRLFNLTLYIGNIIQINSGITSGRVLDGELFYTQRVPRKLERNLYETVCRQMQIY